MMDQMAAALAAKHPLRLPTHKEVHVASSEGQSRRVARSVGLRAASLGQDDREAGSAPAAVRPGALVRELRGDEESRAVHCASCAMPATSSPE